MNFVYVALAKHIIPTGERYHCPLHVKVIHSPLLRNRLFSSLSSGSRSSSSFLRSHWNSFASELHVFKIIGNCMLLSAIIPKLHVIAY